MGEESIASEKRDDFHDEVNAGGKGDGEMNSGTDDERVADDVADDERVADDMADDGRDQRKNDEDEKPIFVMRPSIKRMLNKCHGRQPNLDICIKVSLRMTY